MPEKENQASSKSWLRRFRVVMMILGPLLLVGGGVWYYISSQGYVSTDDAYVEMHRVTISPQVAGRVIAVPVHDNEVVHKGEVLLRLDSAPYDVAVRAAEAKLQEVTDQVRALKEKYKEKQAAIRQAVVEEQYLRRQLGRQGPLARQQVIANAKLDRLHTDYLRARQNVAMLKAGREELLAQLGNNANQPLTQNSRYLAALSALAKARLDLSYTVVRAPANGIVAKVNIRTGDMLGAGSPAFPLMETGIVWVKANFKETALTHMRPGDPVDVTIDSYPNQVFHGHVESISPGSGAEFSLLPPENASGNWVKVVQRFPVRIELDRKSNKPTLRAGMSAEVQVYVGSKS